MTGDEDDGEEPGRSIGPVRRRLYIANAGKHGGEETDWASREPRDGQEALDFSVRVKPISPARVAVDYEERCFVVLRRHDLEPFPGQPDQEIFHGYVVTWQRLPQEMRNALHRAGMADRKGRIL